MPFEIQYKFNKQEIDTHYFKKRSLTSFPLLVLLTKCLCCNMHKLLRIDTQSLYFRS